MRHLLFIILGFIAINMTMSCSSKADKQKGNQTADSLDKESMAQRQHEDSLQIEQMEKKLKEDKIALLKQLYENVVYPKDDNVGASEAFSKNFIRHLSEKVAKALSDYDDGIEYEVVNNDNSPKLYLFGDQGDYGNEGPKISYDYVGKGWFKVTISGEMSLKVKIDSDKDDDDNLIITGLEIPNYNISIKP